MAVIGITRHLSRMRRDWDRRAKENARHYVVTGQQQWNDQEFYRSGQVTLEEEILNDLTNICQGRDPKEMRVLEIGCGAGRVTRAFAGYFGEVWGVDISREMVRQAREACAGFPNAHVIRNNGKDLRAVSSPWRERFGWRKPEPFDFAFSFMVFQHIPNRRIIESYVREVHRLLRPGGLFKFQVQGSPLAEAEVRHSWVGVSFSERDAREMAARCGFEMRYQYGAGDQYYWLWFFKP
ncbi:MAG TPA: methyltransferase domain-containing protein [Candidatus Acidoferrales bacterium]|nr:methyltransferase domain-containing protein [Candidatus Acidoferrales bacterium]